jgi:hypothetical protein
MSMQQMNLLDCALLGQDGCSLLIICKEGCGKVRRLISEVLEDVKVVVVGGIPSGLDGRVA